MYPCSENKGADQLCGNREADLRLCFRICIKPVFSRCGSNGRASEWLSFYTVAGKLIFYISRYAVFTLSVRNVLVICIYCITVGAFYKRRNILQSLAEN